MSSSRKCVVGGFVVLIMVVCLLKIGILRSLIGHRVNNINEWRLQHLKQACLRSNNGGHTNLQPAFYLHSKNHTLLYCLVFKAATSSWFHNFNSWAGYTDYQIMHVDNLFLARKFYPKENRVTLMHSFESSFSFIVVRHPFERLISAFEDRLLKMNNVYYSRLSRAIYNRYHPTTKGVVSFRDFVQYIIDDVAYSNSTSALDIHWCPVNNLCTPCLARYDYIVKMETYEQDLEALVKAAKLEGIVKVKHVNHGRKEPVHVLAGKYFSQISQKQMDSLYGIYEIDFELFGYSADVYFQIPKALE